MSASLGYNIYFLGNFFWKPFSVVASVQGDIYEFNFVSKCLSRPLRTGG